MLRLQEFRSQRVELRAEQAVHLAALTRASSSTVGSGERQLLQALTPTSTAGIYDVQPGPYVGRLSIGGLAIDIESRFAFRNLLHVLATAARVPHLPALPPVPLGAGHGLVDVVAAAYAGTVEHLVGVGLAKAYVERQFTRPPYPGVPAATVHLARFAGRPDRLVTTARRLTVDTTANQALRSALDVLLGGELADPATRRRLLQLVPAFAGTTAVAVRAALAASRDRSAPSRYRAALGLAAVVLSGRSLMPAGLEASGPSLVFLMTEVWERFLAVHIAQRLPVGHRLLTQHPVPLTDSGPTVTARADFVEVDGTGTPVRVLDAKYKHLPGQPAAGDLYQMVTYAQRLGVREAELLHPGRGEVVEVAVGSLRVTLRGVDVLQGSGSPAGRGPRLALQR